MNHVFAFLFAPLAFLSCNADPHIGPEPIDASINETSSSSSSASSASSSASSSSSSSASSSSGGPEGDVSGSRLKRYVHTSQDGLLSLYGFVFYDSALQLDCAPTITPTGRRCMPYTSMQTLAAYFRDATCTTPVVFVATGCAAPKYITTYGAGVCGSGTAKSFAVGALLPHAAYYKNGASCLPCIPSQIDAYDVYEHLGEVDYTQFAAMTLEHE